MKLLDGLSWHARCMVRKTPRLCNVFEAAPVWLEAVSDM